MTNERKARLFEALVEYIADNAAENGKTDEEIKEIFLEIGFTEKEYQEEIEL